MEKDFGVKDFKKKLSIYSDVQSNFLSGIQNLGDYNLIRFSNQKWLKSVVLFWFTNCPKDEFYDQLNSFQKVNFFPGSEHVFQRDNVFAKLVTKRTKF